MNSPTFAYLRFTARIIFALFAFIYSVGFASAESTDPGGGIGGTGITGFGVVQKFGSIFVNGREFFIDNNTRVTHDGVIANENQLHLGDVVSVQGRIDETSGRSVAMHVDSETALEGAIEKLDVASGTLMIMGQTVHVMSSTLNDGPGNVPLAARIHVGDRIAVSGFTRSDSSWNATRITQLAAGEPRFVLHGAVQSIDQERGRIRVNGQDLVASSNKLLARLETGNIVRVDGHYGPDILRIDSVSIDRPKLGLAGQVVEMSGYIQTQFGPRQVVSNDVALRYSDATTFIGGTAADMRQDVPVVVRGVMQADGGVAVREVLVNVEPMRATLPVLNIRPSHEGMGEKRAGHGAPERPEHEKPEPEKAGAERHDINRPERPEIERPEIERPEIERPAIELPEIEKPENDR